MFCKGFEISRVTGIKFQDLMEVYGPQDEPIQFVDFRFSLCYLAKAFIESLHQNSDGKTMADLNCYHEDELTLALYRYQKRLSLSSFRFTRACVQCHDWNQFSFCWRRFDW